jgi:hypothetical protein
LFVREWERQRGDLKHLSVHQWIRFAIPDSQQPTSPIGFLFLKLPPPPCAVLLVMVFITLIKNNIKRTYSLQFFTFLSMFSNSFQFFSFSYNYFQFFPFFLQFFSILFNSFQFFPILLPIPKNCPKIEEYEKNCQKRIEELPKTFENWRKRIEIDFYSCTPQAASKNR